MFAVYRTESDGCTYTSNVLLFVTENEQVAKDAVALAELEHETALKIPVPTWTSKYNGSDGAKRRTDAWEEHSENLQNIFTVDNQKTYYLDPNTEYFYEKVAVR